ncbi:MAG: SGNH/GDSL hydrolase family protein [Lentisphaerae bacterium]|nr:SGNH/GDSL hydrolase family protein [Lentisphaerota bacterium]MCP4101381.1 SGNH/GDSL hydrolase family protein [Lentisphaerota bacterium]
MHKFYLSLLLTALPLITFAKAGINIYLYNQSTSPITITQKDDSGKIEKTQQVVPRDTVLFNYVATGQIFDLHLTKYFQILKDNSVIASISLKLDNNWNGYSYKFKDLQGNIGLDDMTKDWHSWYGTPGVTITAYPEKIEITNSDILNNVKRVLIFGDSVSDKGTLFEYTKGIIPTSRCYYNGMFSNSDVWSKLLKDDLGPFGIEVSNYSVGGATAIFNSDFEHLPYSLKGQLEVFQTNASLKGWNNFNQFLAINWIGGNDYLTEPADLSADKIASLTSNVVSSIKQNTIELINKGISKFVFINQPDLSLVPESRLDLKNTTATEALSTQHNQKLQEMVAQLQTEFPNKTFKLIDIYSLFRSGINNINEFNQKYGTSITNVTDSCWQGGYTAFEDRGSIANMALPNTADIRMALMVAKSGEMSGDPDDYFFWDRVHPTKQVQQALYNYILACLNVTVKQTASQ